MSRKAKIEHETGSGNVFSDLGLEDADELLIRAQLGLTVRMILKEQNLKQAEICKLLGLGQAEVSKLMGGKYHLFSEKRLLSFLEKLNKQVIMTVVDRPEGAPASQVVYA
jgi:predicted XRE-type DNA-binding protein